MRLKKRLSPIVNARNNNIEKIITSHPVYIYFSAIILGMGTVFSLFAYANTHFGFELEKRGTYIYYNDYYLNLEQNYVPRIFYENLVHENKNLRENLMKNNTENIGLYIQHIDMLKNELAIKSDELIRYTSSMKVNLNGDQQSINIDTEKYKLLSNEIETIRDQIDSLYKKI